jgi:hypothetical protein
MGLKFEKVKKRNLLLSVLYRLSKLFFFLRPVSRLKFFLDLEWIFERLAHEEAIKARIDIRPRDGGDFLLKYIKNTDRVLELGCSVGHKIKKISEATRKITGVDRDKKYLSAARREFRDPEINFVCDDVFHYAENIGEKDFDTAILSQIIEHLEDPKKLLTDLSQKVAKIYIEVPDFEKTHLNLYRQALDMNLSYGDSDHIYEFDRSELKDLAESCGLEIFDSDYRFGFIKFWCKRK